MKPRGKPSVGHLSVVPVAGLLPGDRPDAPAGMGAAAAAEWRAIVSRMPPQWFTREQFPVLAALCQATAESNKIAEALSKFQVTLRTDEAKFKRFKELNRMHSAYIMTIGQLSTKLRLTQQSRYDNRKSADVAQRSSGRARPWERNLSVDHDDAVRSGGAMDRDAGRARGLADQGNQSGFTTTRRGHGGRS